MRERYRTLRLLLGMAVRAAPAAFLLSITLEPIGFAISVVSGVWLKWMTDAAVLGDLNRALLGGGGYAVTMAAVLLFQGVGVRLRMNTDERMRIYLDGYVARLAARASSLQLFERPDLLDQIGLIRQNQERLGRAAGTLILTVAFVMRILTGLVILVSLHPAFLLLPVLALAPVGASILQERLVQRADEETAESRRLAEHLVTMATTAGSAKEIKIFGLEGEIQRRYEQEQLWLGRTIIRARWRGALFLTAAWLLAGGGVVGGIALVAFRAGQGLATPGDVLMALHVAVEVAGNVGPLAYTLADFAGVLRLASYLTWLERHVQETAVEPANPVPAPARLQHSIVMKGVSFRYPGTTEWVLRDVNLELPAGSVVALVGENGAGKSSLVKLLNRLYEPTEGSILVDGIDLASIPIEEWRNRCSAAFQDFARLELVARESVGVGDMPRMTDEQAVRGALERAGADDFPAQLEQGLDTLLGRTWGGADLSGGQWQKVAVGRGMMRDQPLLLTLDEPTAALDPDSEYALFLRYAATAQERKAKGGITLLVTHRFSTVRVADLIVALQHGRVVEKGDHRTLIEQGGLYAELYELQARSYVS
jgi:ATP-binding cassette, subfamily B, bacterial